jgi:hypothetical protein
MWLQHCVIRTDPELHGALLSVPHIRDVAGVFMNLDKELTIK